MKDRKIKVKKTFRKWRKLPLEVTLKQVIQWVNDAPFQPNRKKAH